MGTKHLASQAMFSVRSAPSGPTQSPPGIFGQNEEENEGFVGTQIMLPKNHNHSVSYIFGCGFWYDDGGRCLGTRARPAPHPEDSAESKAIINDIPPPTLIASHVTLMNTKTGRNNRGLNKSEPRSQNASTFAQHTQH